MKYKPTPATLFALAASLCALLVAWFVPLPRIIAGEEEFASKRLPQTRANVMSTEVEFKQAQNRYQTYIKTHDVGALRESAKEIMTKAKSGEMLLANDTTVRGTLAGIDEYTRELQRLAEASEKYLTALRTYDDDLMSWTRSLGAQSESLRSATFPFVEHLKRYPLPLGLAPDPPEIKASTLVEQVSMLEAHIDALFSQAGGSANTLAEIDRDIDNIWASGRSIEYIAGLHDEYYADLRTYDTKVDQQASSNSQPQQSATRRLVAITLNILLGAVTLGGLAALFVPRKDMHS